MWDTACDFDRTCCFSSVVLKQQTSRLDAVEPCIQPRFLEVEGVAKVGFDVALALGITWFMQLSINSRSPFLINV